MEITIEYDRHIERSHSEKSRIVRPTGDSNAVHATGEAAVTARVVTIDVVVPVYNKRAFLGDAVGSIADAVTAFGAARLWLVDNGSTDGSYELLTSQFAEKAIVLKLPVGTISAVRNLGARQGAAGIISFLDCDCLVPPSYFTALASVLQDRAIHATGCLVMLPPNPSWVEAAWNHMHDEGRDGDSQWVNSANFAIRRAAFEQIGGFDKSLETGEDAEICQRIRLAGMRIQTSGRLAVAHLDNAKTLRAFFRKERWRGLGMFGTFSWKAVDKPIAMTLVHAGALIIAAVLPVATRLAPWQTALLMMSLAFTVPVVAVLYRKRRSVLRFSFFKGALLYELYFLARINALLMLAMRRLTR